VETEEDTDDEDEDNEDQEDNYMPYISREMVDDHALRIVEHQEEYS